MLHSLLNRTLNCKQSFGILNIIMTLWNKLSYWFKHTYVHIYMPSKHFAANVPIYARNLVEERNILGTTNVPDEDFEKLDICVVCCIEMWIYGASCTIYESGWTFSSGWGYFGTVLYNHISYFIEQLWLTIFWRVG